MATMQNGLQYHTEGSGLVLPPGSAPRIALPVADTHTVKIIADCGNWEYMVEYPDGYRRTHQAHTRDKLLEKITGQLKMRYNVDDFQFKAIPMAVETGKEIIIGEIKYG